jgi:hypothetical protein
MRKGKNKMPKSSHKQTFNKATSSPKAKKNKMTRSSYFPHFSPHIDKLVYVQLTGKPPCKRKKHHA